MRGAVMRAPGDVRVEDLPEPQIVEPTDAVIELSATCVCGSDLWPYRGVVGSFVASDNTCEICEAGYQSRCVHNVRMGSIGTQAELARIPLADGTLVATPGVPDQQLVPSLMAASDVLGTGRRSARIPRGTAQEEQS